MTTYARSFFDLQLAFARRVAAVSGMPLDRALLDYTNLYIRFGLGRGFDPAHPTWREYLAGLERAADAGAWTHHMYLALGAADGRPDVAAESGCFSCGRLPDGRIRLHFRDAEPDGSSPLSAERRSQRVAELAGLFARVRRIAPEPPRVVGVSWLYNLEAYRRLFPPAYLGTARAIGGRFRHMPLWGQFLDRRGEVRADPAREFLGRLDRLTGLDDLDRCFPLSVLALDASALEFYHFYRISIPDRDAEPVAGPLEEAAMTDRPAADSPVDRELATSRLLDAPRERVFRAFSDPARLARWWGPKGFTNTFQEFDLRPGGAWRFVMHAPNGADYANESVFVEVSPPAHLVLRHLSRPRFELTVTLAEEGGKTRIGWRQRFDTAAECERVRGLATPANEENLDRLEAELARTA